MRTLEQEVEAPLDGLDPRTESLRASAKAALSLDGTPTKKTEHYRFFPVDRVLSASLSMGQAGLEVSSDSKGVVIKALSDFDDAALEKLGELSPNSFFAALNTLRFDDATLVWVEKGAQAKVEVKHHLPAEDSVSYPRLVVVCETGAEVTLREVIDFRERADGKLAVRNGVTELFVGDNASLRHSLAYLGSRDADVASVAQLSNVTARLERDARYHSQVATLGGGLTRLDLRVRLCGPGASAELDGVYQATGREVVDHHVRVEHEAPHCTSHVRHRGLLSGHGHAIFDAISVVHRDAQQTEAHQENRNLLLSDDALVHTKPHLEIDADDVKCSHGATIGTLDADQLFYMRARGIEEPLARAILTFGFVRELLSGIESESLRTLVQSALLERMPYGEALLADLADEDVLNDL